MDRIVSAGFLRATRFLLLDFLLMQKQTWSWQSARVSSTVARMARWGHYGTPVLLFPTAGGDFEEVERFGLIGAVKELIESGRIKVFSVDGLAARAWLRGTLPQSGLVREQRTFEEFVYEEVAPLIRKDCQNDAAEIVTAGAALGGFMAVAMLCRHPNVFRGALCMSGLLDVTRFLKDEPATSELESVSPLHYLPHLPEGSGLAAIRRRYVEVASGEGLFEQPEQSRQLAQALGQRNVPHQLDLWGPNYPHAWPTWRAMLKKYLAAGAARNPA
jgi:esterase/lipase superfamily enzyme